MTTPLTPILKSEIFELIVDTLPLLVVEDTEEGKILYSSRPLETLFGYAVKNATIGKPMDILILPEDLETHRKGRLKYLKDRQSRLLGARGNLRGKKANGEPISVMISLHPGVMHPQMQLIKKEATVAVVVPWTDALMTSPPSSQLVTSEWVQIWGKEPGRVLALLYRVHRTQWNEEVKARYLTAMNDLGITEIEIRPPE